MPSKKQQFSFQGQTSEQLLLISYGTFLELGWTPKYAGPFAIAGYTPRSWNKYEDEILTEAADGTLTVTSSLVHNESFDLLGKNKKHINDFIVAFEKVKATGIKDEWVEELEKLRQQTTETATEQIKQTEEVNAVMNLAGSNLYITYGIIAINVIVFILMAIDGAGIFEANGLTHIKWGSNYSPLTFSGDWWRLITSMFIHFGIIHLALNMYGLYTLGVFLEPMLGKTKFILAYLCTGVFASIASLWWHSEGVNSAGASGAVFGMFGVFLALLLTNLIPKEIRTGLLRSIGIVVGINLIYGLRQGIDNAAHIGGLLSGVLIGFAFYPLLKKNDKDKRNTIALVAMAAITFFIAASFLMNPGNLVSTELRQKEKNAIKELEYPDTKEFYEKYDQFAEIDKSMVNLIYDGSFTYAERVIRNESRMEADVNNASSIIAAMKTLNVSEKAKRRIELLEQLLNARKQNFESIKKLAEADNAPNQMLRAEIREKEEKLLNEIKSLD